MFKLLKKKIVDDIVVGVFKSHGKHVLGLLGGVAWFEGIFALAKFIFLIHLTLKITNRVLCQLNREREKTQ